ncbi:MAG: Na(+)-translocating NADH-quinone reductase subunit A [Gammaproteobacteria bacterium]|nr:Na(+)-translocating NADH-quinone reductase subunit A [Gammaproteobacteria bacterium]
MQYKINKGLKLPITGTPKQTIEGLPNISRVAVLGREHVGMKPTMLVKEGDRVKLGQPLFTDKKNPRVQYVAPGAGEVEVIHRGAKRVFQSLVIRLEGDEEITFQVHATNNLKQLDRGSIVEQLLDSGLWVAMRTRPYSKSPNPDNIPNSIFVTAMDTRPLAADPDVVISEYLQDFKNGLNILTRLTEGSVYVCCAQENSLKLQKDERIKKAIFEGPHPAGIPGTHIHYIDPVNANKSVWHLNYQDVIAYGKLFTEGKIWTDRIISLAGPAIKNPRLLRVRLGASTDDIIEGEVKSGETRIISGSALSGWRAAGWASFLGRFNLQITAIFEGREREFFGWIVPGMKKYSKSNALLSSFFRKQAKFDFTTTQNGSPRAMVPIGVYERVMPLDILPTQLLRALVTKDTDLAQALGCLELDEEDLALCTFVCPSKYEFGPMLRENLIQIEKEG